MAVEYMSLADVESMTGYSRGYLAMLCRTGQIPGAVQIGRAHAVPRKWAEEIVRINEITVPVETAAQLAGVSRRAIELALKSGRLEQIRRRVTKDSLARYIEQRNANGRG